MWKIGHMEFNDSPPLWLGNGGEIQEREVQSEEKEELSDHHFINGIWRNYQEIVDNYRKRSGLTRPFQKTVKLMRLNFFFDHKRYFLKRG